MAQALILKASSRVHNLQLALTLLGSSRFGRKASYMKTYTLIFAGQGPDTPLKVEFDIANPATLFDIAGHHVTGRTAELWDGSNFIGEIRRSNSGHWRISDFQRVK